MNQAMDKLMTRLIIILSFVYIALMGMVVYLSIQYENSDKNAVIIYYKGYSTPRIRYRYDTEPWGPIDGEAMETNTSGLYADKATHRVVIPLKKYNYILASFNDGAGNLDDNDSKYYTFKKGSYLYDNGMIVKLDKKFGG